MRTAIATAIILLPLATIAQSNNFTKCIKCKLETEGTDPFTGKERKSTEWFVLSGQEEPLMNAQFVQNGDNYFLNIVFCPQQFPPNYSGFNAPDSTNKNVLQVKFDTGEIVTFNLMATQSQHHNNTGYSYYGNSIGTTSYYPVYAISKEQLQQLALQNIIKIRVYYNNGYFCDTNTDIYSMSTAKKSASCLMP